MKPVIIIAITISFGILFFPQGIDAKEFFPSANYRIDEIPTFCTKNPPSSTFNELKASDKWTDLVENAVLYWESELKNSSEHPEVWNMNFKKIPDNLEYSDDCTVILQYEQYSLWYGLIGVFYIDEWLDSPLDEWLDSPLDDVDAGKILIFDESFICVQVCENFDPQKIMYETIVHEMGHSLGLGHFTYDDKEKNKAVETGSTEFPSIMYPFSSQFVPDATITSKDLSKLQKIYGTYGFFAFTENKPIDLFDENIIIIEGIPLTDSKFFKGTSISEEKIHESTSRYDTKLLVASGRLDNQLLVSGQKVILQMLHPDGVAESFSVTTKSSGEFQLTFQIDNTYPIGIYTIEPSYMGIYSEEFKITFEIVPSYEEIIKEEKIIEDKIKQITSYDYEIILPGNIELSYDSSRKVSGYLVPNTNNPKDPSNITIYLFLRNFLSYPYSGFNDYLISSTNVNNDLTFTFNVKTNDLISFKNSVLDGSQKIFVGFDKVFRTKYDSEKSFDS